jgi:hypothetical protein
MNIRNLMERYGFFKCPTLRVVNPRLGTSIVPLRKGDGEILYSFLKEEIHALHFSGDEDELRSFVGELQQRRGVVVQRMTMSEGRTDRVMNLHLRMPDFQEIRRVIRLPH